MKRIQVEIVPRKTHWLANAAVTVVAAAMIAIELSREVHRK